MSDWAPTPQLNENQVGVMTKVARGKIKAQATFKSIEADGHHRERIDQHYNDMIALVDLGLMYNVTTLPVYQKIVDQYKADNGRDLVILRPTPVGEAMFKSRGADKWEN